jgi:rubrerythrin
MEEQQPGVKLAFYVGFLNVKEKGAFPAASEAEQQGELHPCPSCGQMTTRPGLCAFCSTVKMEFG